MQRRRSTLEDGRYLGFYAFDEEKAAELRALAAPVVWKKEASGE